MNSRIISKSANSAQSVMYSESSIHIVLNVDYINAIVPFLLTQQIPFTLSSIGRSSELIEADKNEVIAEKKELISTVSGNLNIERVHTNIVTTQQAKLIQKIYQKYIVECIEKNPPKGEEIAAEMGVSEAQFKALFKKCYGKPFYQIYIKCKMEHAAQLLLEGYTSVIVSERIGYTQPIKFNKMFQKYFGMTPKKYQQSLN